MELSCAYILEFLSNRDDDDDHHHDHPTIIVIIFAIVCKDFIFVLWVSLKNFKRRIRKNSKVYYAVCTSLFLMINSICLWYKKFTL